MSSLPFRTVRDVFRWAVSSFNEAQLCFGHGCESAIDEAAYLILHTLHLPLDQLDIFLDAALTPPEIERLLSVLRRRIEERIPAAYLTRQAWLHNHVFYVDERVIVPRSYLATLLVQQLAPWVENPDEIKTVLDLCTGSGCLAILAALAFPNAQVDAVDLSTEALAVAHQNVAAYALQEKIELRCSDLFKDLPAKTYDLILCNPPYVNTQSMAALPPEYRHEPSLALAGGVDGMDLIKRVIAELPHRLTKKGALLLEIGHEKMYFDAAFPNLDAIWIQVADKEHSVAWIKPSFS